MPNALLLWLHPRAWEQQVRCGGRGKGRKGVGLQGDRGRATSMDRAPSPAKVPAPQAVPVSPQPGAPLQGAS